MYDVKVYDLTSEANRQLSPHFQVYEFACTDGSRPVFVSQTLVDILENIRVHFGQPLHINSGYRTVSYNAQTEGSSPKSQHCNGLAADIWVEGHTPAEVYAYAEALRCQAARVTQALPRAVERIMETQMLLAAEAVRAVNVHDQVKAAIDGVADPLRRDILTRRYILGQRWERIAADQNFTLRRVLQLHRSTVDRMEIA